MKFVSPRFGSWRQFVEDDSRAAQWRWFAVCIFVLSSTLNYMDRQVLSVFAPYIVGHFHVSLTQFGWLLSAFSITYAAVALLAGWFLDRVGVNRAISTAVGWWSTAAIASGLAPSFGILAICRAALGAGECAGVPAVGKLNGIYLKPEERALGAAVNQIGLSLGAALIPLWAALIAYTSWRVPFVLTGLLGFLWLPLWRWVSRRIPPAFDEPESPQQARRSSWSILKDRDLLLLVFANLCWMGSYSLWSNWGVLYYVRVYGLSVKQAASYLWLPPLVSNAGGFFGGWLSLWWMRKLVPAVSARRRAVWFSAAGSLLTLLLPWAGTPKAATLVICVSYFFALAGSVNIYALPIDIFSPARAGMAIAALTFAFGILQTFLSPALGYLADHGLYSGMVWLVTAPLLVSALLLQFLRVRTAEVPLPRALTVRDSTAQS